MQPAAVLAAFAGLAILLVAVVAFQFNRMVTLRNRCTESWSNVDTELRRRHDLVPNLVAVVRGYARHERGLVEAVTAARARAAAAQGSPEKRAPGEEALAAGLERLLAVAEAYPELQAHRNFLELQRELAITEDRIQAARRFYNANVRDYRDQTRQFPGVLFARMFGMGSIPFFELGAHAYRAAPKVAA